MSFSPLRTKRVRTDEVPARAFDSAEQASGPTPQAGGGGPKVLYLLYTADLYGTEQMAVEHLRAIQDRARVLIVAPPGPLHGVAQALGIPTVQAASSNRIFRAALQFARGPGPLTVLTASVRHSLIGLAAASLLPWKRVRHFNICHGGTDLRRSYGLKRVFNNTPVRLIAVSHYCATLLHRYGVPAERITVVANFLADERCQTEAVRTAPDPPRLRVVAVTRLVQIKRVGLLIDALKLEPALVQKVSVTIVGAGELLDELSASAEGLDVTFTGFRSDVDVVLADADIFVQTCAIESFGLALAEAMAAGVFVVAPDRGGSAEIVGDQRHGLLYTADDAQALAAALLRAVEMPSSERAAIAAAGAARVRAEYSRSSRRQRLLEVFLGD